MDDMGQEFDVNPELQQNHLNQALSGAGGNIPNMEIAQDLSDSDELADNIDNVDELDGGNDMPS